MKPEGVCHKTNIFQQLWPYGPVCCYNYPQWNKLPPEAKMAPDVPAFIFMLEKKQNLAMHVGLRQQPHLRRFVQ